MLEIRTKEVSRPKLTAYYLGTDVSTSPAGSPAGSVARTNVPLSFESTSSLPPSCRMRSLMPRNAVGRLTRELSLSDDPGAKFFCEKRDQTQKTNPPPDRPVSDLHAEGSATADSSEPAPSPQPWIFASGATPARIGITLPLPLRCSPAVKQQGKNKCCPR